MGDRSLNIDLVHVVDATGSMRLVMDYVKSTVLTLHDDIADVAALNGYDSCAMRVRLISFRDLADGRHPALAATEMLDLPNALAEFEDEVGDLTPVGGLDDDESALEALSVALSSAWSQGPGARRHIVILYTDAGAHPLGGGNRAAEVGSVPSQSALDAQWANMDPAAKRLFICAPDCRPWLDVLDGWGWDKTVHFVSKAAHGMSDTVLESVLAWLVDEDAKLS